MTLLTALVAAGTTGPVIPDSPPPPNIVGPLLFGGVTVLLGVATLAACNALPEHAHRRRGALLLVGLVAMVALAYAAVGYLP